MKQTAPFGTWVSPVTVELACGQTMRMGELSAEGGELYWLEQRPSDKGRTALVRRSADGQIEDISPPGADVGTRVHEYGGGSYTVGGGRVLWSSRLTATVWLLDPQAGPASVEIAAIPACRFADFRFMANRKSAVCVREDHRYRPG